MVQDKNTTKTKLNRFNGWVAIVAFSCVVLGTLVENISTSSPRTSIENYVISCCSISIILGFFAFLGHIFANKLVSGPIEVVTGLVVFGIWCAGIAIIQNPSNSLALNSFESLKVTRIVNPNLYFFSWASFFSSTYVLFTIAQEHDVVNVQSIPSKLMKWNLLFITCLVLLSVGSTHKELACSSLCPFELTLSCPNDELCRKTNYTVALGVVAGVMSLIPIAMTHFDFMIPMVESVVALVILVLYSVAVAVVTNNMSGPAGEIGNLYFACWFGFALSLFLTFTCLKGLLCPEEETEEEDGEEGAIARSESNRGSKDKKEEQVPVEEIEA